MRKKTYDLADIEAIHADVIKAEELLVRTKSHSSRVFGVSHRLTMRAETAWRRIRDLKLASGDTLLYIRGMGQ